MTIDPGHLAEWITWTGVAVAVIGAAEAAPDGSARIWSWTRDHVRIFRGWLARFVPWLRGRPVTVQGVTANVNVTMPKPGISGTGYVWNPAASDKDKIETLFQMYRQQGARIGEVERQAREQAEAVRAEALRELTEVRGVTSSIIGQLRQNEARSAQADARGIVVVAGGIVLTGLAAQLALCWPAAVVVAVAVLAAMIRVGYLVVRDWRARQDRAAG